MTTNDTITAGPEERMINKVMMLLAKAESTTPEEAEALVAKATIQGHGLRLGGAARNWDDEIVLALAEWLREQIDCE